MAKVYQNYQNLIEIISNTIHFVALEAWNVNIKSISTHSFPSPHTVLLMKTIFEADKFFARFFVHKVLVNCYPWNSQIKYDTVCNEFFFTFMYYTLKNSLALRVSKTIMNLWSCRLLSTPGKKYLFVLIIIKILTYLPTFLFISLLESSLQINSIKAQYMYHILGQ